MLPRRRARAAGSPARVPSAHRAPAALTAAHQRRALRRRGRAHRRARNWLGARVELAGPARAPLPSSREPFSNREPGGPGPIRLHAGGRLAGYAGHGAHGVGDGALRRGPLHGAHATALSHPRARGHGDDGVCATHGDRRDDGRRGGGREGCRVLRGSPRPRLRVQGRTAPHHHGDHHHRRRRACGERCPGRRRRGVVVAEAPAARTAG
mmetsp:Transcript_12109/g.31681  ORF Transcript_12109/g.31681 Transcript_12109/m.31681 type:complete len:209 (+) Transcript_12109:124-750(+)